MQVSLCLPQRPGERGSHIASEACENPQKPMVTSQFCWTLEIEQRWRKDWIGSSPKLVWILPYLRLVFDRRSQAKLLFIHSPGGPSCSASPSIPYLFQFQALRLLTFFFVKACCLKRPGLGPKLGPSCVVLFCFVFLPFPWVEETKQTRFWHSIVS